MGEGAQLYKLLAKSIRETSCVASKGREQSLDNKAVVTCVHGLILNNTMLCGSFRALKRVFLN